MSQKKPKNDSDNPKPDPLQECFVITPISDQPGYAPGYFKELYDHVIEPACEGLYQPRHAGLTSGSDLIVRSIIEDLIDTPMAICVLSGLNPNVMYELGVRHALRMPVVLLCDNRTELPFDIQATRVAFYDESLMPSATKAAIAALREFLLAMRDKNGVPDSPTTLFDDIDIRRSLEARYSEVPIENLLEERLNAIDDQTAETAAETAALEARTQILEAAVERTAAMVTSMNELESRRRNLTTDRDGRPTHLSGVRIGPENEIRNNFSHLWKPSKKK